MWPNVASNIWRYLAKALTALDLDGTFYTSMKRRSILKGGQYDLIVDMKL